MPSNIDTSGLEKRLRSLRKNEFPTAMRNTINDLMRDVIKREQKEVERVFDRPTSLVRNAFRIKNKATKKRLHGAVWIKDVHGRGGNALLNTLTPHIPGHPALREAKGMERSLRNAGLMRSDQYLMPSRTMRLNAAGNVSGSVASKMLNDIQAFRGVSGFTSETKSAKVRYVWGHAKARSGGLVTGIWLKTRFQKGTPGALQMVVVDTAPRYSKRFKFYSVAKSWAMKRGPHHAKLAVKHSIRRRGR